MDKAVFTSGLAGIVLTDHGSVPMHESLYRQIRERIISNKLPRGIRLPSSRGLSERLGCSRPTVVTAYENLKAEGYLSSRQGSGTYVPDVLPEDHLLKQPRDVQVKSATIGGPDFLSGRGQLLAQLRYAPVGSYGLGTTACAFSPAEPDVSLFPFSVWTAIAARVWKKPSIELVSNEDPAGFRGLREAIANYLGIIRGVRCSPDQVVITSGTHHTFDLVARLLLDPGDKVWVENPTLTHLVLGPLRSFGAQPVATPVDGSGLVVDAGRSLAPNAKLAIVTPSNQYPLGVTMSAARRCELLDWASREKAWVLEDDYDSELSYHGLSPATLFSQAEDERVILAGTFSKVLFRGIRLGYMVLPTRVVPAFVEARRKIDHGTSMLNQSILARFMQDGHFYAHTRRMLQVYKQRSDLFHQVIRSKLSHMLSARNHESGINAFVEFSPALAERLSDLEARQRAQVAGIQVRGISEYYLSEPTRRGMLLGFGAVPDEEIEPSLLKLAAALSTPA